MRIAAITMARNDEFFLSRWVDYYSRELGVENLYIMLDGIDQEPPQNGVGANIKKFEHHSQQVAAGDRHRIDIISDEVAQLFRDGYDLVIGGDADEFLVVAPKVGMSLAEYLASRRISTTISGLGLDVGQKLGEEAVLDHTRLFLEQRSYALVSTRYTKASVVARAVRWGSGFHRVRGANFHIDPNLYLLHFGCVDEQMICAKFGGELMADGWARHLHKRLRTIRIISSRRGHHGESWLRLARLLQTILRPPYCWNKPAMLGWRLVIKLPKLWTL